MTVPLEMVALTTLKLAKNLSVCASTGRGGVNYNLRKGLSYQIIQKKKCSEKPLKTEQKNSNLFER